MSRLKFIVLTLVMAAMLTGCYNSTSTKKNVFVSGDVGSGNPDTLSDEEEQTDSINDAFYNKHHYAQNYNFVVTADSLPLLRQQPEELLVNLPTDTITVYHNDRLVVVDFRLLKNDAVDSVWIEVARDQYTFGWVREKHLLKSTVPDDPISQFILTFSNVHLRNSHRLSVLQHTQEEGKGGAFQRYRLVLPHPACHKRGIGCHILFQHTDVRSRNMAALLLSSFA